MITVPLLLLVVALILFALVFFGVGGGRFNLLAGGLFCYVLAQMWPLVR